MNLVINNLEIPRTCQYYVFIKYLLCSKQFVKFTIKNIDVQLY